jgi:hypothetical protein
MRFKNCKTVRRSDILKSNFIIFLSLLLGTITIGFISEMNDHISGLKSGDLLSVFQIGIFGSIFSFFTYGIFVWPIILLLNLFIEVVSFKTIVSFIDLKKLLLLEILIVFFIALSLSSNYQYYYWLLLVPIFSIGQFIRLKFLK